MTETERFVQEFIAQHLYWWPLWPPGRTTLDVAVTAPSRAAVAALGLELAREFPDMSQHMINEYPGGTWRVRLGRRRKDPRP